MKNTLVFLFVLAALAGCKGSETIKANEKGDPGLGGIEVPAERAYTESELVIGRRICSALKTKRTLFEKLTDQVEQIKFRGENLNCDTPLPFNNSEFVVKVSNASSSSLEYVAFNRNNYLKDVITDQTGVMKLLCDNLAVSDSVSNTNLMNSSYLTVNLLIDEGYDRFEISKRTRDSAGNYPVISVEGVNVFTMTSQIDKKFFGNEQERIRYISCPNSKISSYVKQKWVNAITTF